MIVNGISLPIRNFVNCVNTGEWRLERSVLKYIPGKPII